MIMNGIVTISLSPVIDIHYSADSFEAGRDNIVHGRRMYAAGKAMNVSRGLHAVGISAEAYMLLGEENASEYLRLAADYGVPISCITTDGAVRENISVNTPAGETRICTKDFTISSKILPVLGVKVASKLSAGMAVVISGSLPKGITQKDFISFVRFIKGAVPDSKIILDCPTLSLEAIKEIEPFLIKPNKEEAIALLGGESALATSLSAKEAKELCERAKCDYCVISCGADGAVFASSDGTSGSFAAPEIPECHSTVGAGDSMLAGILYSFMKDIDKSCYDLPEAVKWGLAFGSASCMNKGTEPPAAEDIFQLLSF